LFVRKLGHPFFVPVIVALHVSSPNRVPRIYYWGIAQLCEGAPFQVRKGEFVTPRLWLMPSSDAVPHGTYYTCSTAQRWTLPLLSRMMGLLGLEQPLVAEGGSGVQIMLGNRPLCRVFMCDFDGRGLSVRLGTWKSNVAGWENIFCYISNEQLAFNAPNSQCVTLADGKVVRPMFNFFIHFREQ
jgi:hypothetical protein